MPKFKKNVSPFRMKGFSGFKPSPLQQDTPTTVTPTTVTPTTVDVLELSDTPSTKTPGPSGHERYQYERLSSDLDRNIDVSSDSKIAGGDKTNVSTKDTKKTKKKISSDITAAIISSTLPVITEKLLEEEEPLPPPEIESTAEAFSQMQFGTGQGMISPITKKNHRTRTIKKDITEHKI